jgi:VIT1/CCC1 family predicted Fe2+/Mn2+ transporter
MVDSVIEHWRDASDKDRLLQIVQPGLIGLIDGTVSAALGAAISMGISEGLSDDGSLTGRGDSLTRGVITGVATFIGGSAHALPFLISDLGTALAVAYPVVACELVAIAWVRRRFLRVPLAHSLLQVTLAGAMVAGVGVAVGQA